MTNLHPGPLPAAAVVLAAVPYDHPQARSLTRDLYTEQVATYGFADDPSTTSDASFNPGLFVVALLGGRAVGCGGWRLLGPRTAEIKRMYVQPQFRGLSLGARILDHLEADAAAHGASRLVLETGAANHAALALYRLRGYRPMPSYVAGRDPAINRALGKTVPRPPKPD
ncbi:GNAT family N-acetyltransferase [Streptomonospora nanhaiensis]|uniref:Ribosomal protein S18 acetylase RimI-like enzyme n=1 Tax=Streptomonospora nanhaiensis TaxID=1323731 RepID=A0A853BT01_9ACTN|nr:GNAT family N-acetyltransferase [Streptomonospora nanhaiensis]MBV2366214.1 GNAT family N-acetyltransferase [Streptomonospora nanhaiensis]NYI98273.1 ribosomal protein S18 acetylase RimI-like enzyme [Streptomonospora nanhaiensis]